MCGEEYGIGQWPLCGPGGHGRPLGLQTFQSYVDEHISTDGTPVEITSWRDKQKLLRPHWRGDFMVQMREREPMRRGAQTARIDRERQKRGMR